jgi:hypothetical protein
MKAKDKKAVVTLLDRAFTALKEARDRAGKRYEPLHEEIADICDDVVALMLTMQNPDFKRDWLEKTDYPLTRLSDDRNQDISPAGACRLPVVDSLYLYEAERLRAQGFPTVFVRASTNKLD